MIVCKKCGYQNPDGTTFCQRDGTYLGWDPNSEHTDPVAKAGVRLLIVPNVQTVEAGATGAYELSIQNTGDVVDAFKLEVRDATWMTVNPPVVNVYPQESTKARIDARPPRDSSMRAGQTRFTVRATSQANPQVFTEEMAVVDVGGFNDVAARLTPPTSRTTSGTANHVVTIDNGGNRQLRGRVRASDPEAALMFEVTPQTFNIAPGESAAAQVVVRAADQSSPSVERQRKFQVQVESEGSAAVVLDGTMVQVPVVQVRRRWWPLVAAAALALLVLMPVGAWAYGHLNLAGSTQAGASPSSSAEKSPVAHSPSPVAPADITVSPNLLDWSPLQGASGTVLVAHVSNGAGAGQATLTGFQIQGDTAYVVDPSSTCAAGTVLNPGQQCAIDIAFKPQAKGPHQASLVLTATGGSVKTVQLTYVPPVVAGIPNVYGLAPSAAVAALSNAGYPATTTTVCSSAPVGSVAGVVSASNPNLALDGPSGVTAAGQSLPQGTSVVVYVSRGILGCIVLISPIPRAT